MKALILAAGAAKRLSSYCGGHQKCMLRVGGRPLVEYSLMNAVTAGVEEIVLVVGHRAEDVVNAYGLAFQDTPIRYVVQDERRGLVHAIECSRSALGGRDFLLLLADEIVRGPEHAAMIEAFHADGAFVTCGVVDGAPVEEICKTYSVLTEGGERRATRLIEKPDSSPNNLQGTGSCVFRGDIFRYLEHTPVNPTRGERDLADLVQCAIDDGQLVNWFEIGTDYINVNTPEDFQRARRHYDAQGPWRREVH